MVFLTIVRKILLAAVIALTAPSVLCPGLLSIQAQEETQTEFKGPGGIAGWGGGSADELPDAQNRKQPAISDNSSLFQR